MPRTPNELDIALAKADVKIARLETQNSEFGTRLTALEKLLAAGPTVAQSLAEIATNTDRMAKAAHGPYGGEQ